MRIYRYWARAKESCTQGAQTFDVSTYGGSNLSVEDALRQAEERARAASRAIEHGSIGDEYAYSDRPLREEIVDEIGGEAVITRNAYGAQVINTPDVLFADVDLAEGGMASRLMNALADLLRRPSPKADDPWSRIGDGDGPNLPNVPGGVGRQIVLRLQRIVDVDRRMGLRLYRTHGGFRVLATTRTYQADRPEAERLMTDLGTDPLYMRLCRAQDCFRARLSPKPWRCGLEVPPTRFPRESDASQQRFEGWLRTYEQATRSYATCAFIGTFGREEVHPAVAPVLEAHDRLACAVDAPLA
ncbi:MAG: hypothetical protein CMJ18_01060 [Phycisphaeraceae bacterium]|nr:hypothetical protein [Phycisphaeraceae bacterium]